MTITVQSNSILPPSINHLFLSNVIIPYTIAKLKNINICQKPNLIRKKHVINNKNIFIIGSKILFPLYFLTVLSFRIVPRIKIPFVINPINRLIVAAKNMTGFKTNSIMILYTVIVPGIGNQLTYKYPLIIETINHGKYLKKNPSHTNV
jgi:hypothetical protein